MVSLDKIGTQADRLGIVLNGIGINTQIFIKNTPVKISICMIRIVGYDIVEIC
jgi:hypothetical protein